MTPSDPKRMAARKRLAPEVHIPLREMRDVDGGVYFIAPEMYATDLVLNVPDYVVMVHLPRDSKPPQLVFRMRVEE